MSKIRGIKERHANATPGPWTGSMNWPFYAVVHKPAPSLSKHDDERSSYWRCADAAFTVSAHVDMAFLLSQLEIAKEGLANITQGCPECDAGMQAKELLDRLNALDVE